MDGSIGVSWGRSSAQTAIGMIATDDNRVNVLVNTLCDLIGKFTLRDRGRFFPPVSRCDLATHKSMPSSRRVGVLTWLHRVFVG